MAGRHLSQIGRYPRPQLAIDEDARFVRQAEIAWTRQILAPFEIDATSYSRARSPDDLARRYRELLATITSLELLAGFCHTQLADTYQETSGLLYADRTPKFPIEDMAAATSRAMPLAEPALAGRDGAA